MLFTCSWFRLWNKVDFFEESGEHTDEMETSLIMYLNLELVLPLEEAGDGNEKKSTIQGLQEKWPGQRVNGLK